MSNVEHSALTGSDLHEPKGAAAAAANRVYVSNGSGSGSWTTVSNDVLASAAKAFQAQLLHVQDQKSSGTAGGTFTSGAWRTRTLNTVVTNEISGASLSSDQITLPAGTYWIEARAPAYIVNEHKVKVYNVSDSTDILIGTSEHSNYAGGYAQTSSFVSGRFTLASSKTISLMHRCASTSFSNGFGDASGFSVVEVYADVKIWKVA